MPEREKVLKNRMSRVRILGYTLYCSWVLAVFYSTIPYVSAPDFRLALYSNLVLSLIALAATLLLIAAFMKRGDKWVLSLRVIIPSSITIAIATIILLFIDNSSSLSFSLIIISAILSGISSAFLFLGWVRIFTDIGSKVALIETSLSWVIAALTCAVITLIPTIAASAIVVASSLVSGIILRRCTKKRLGCAKPKRKIALPKKSKWVLKRGLIAVLNFGFIAGFSDLISGFRLFAIPDAYGIALLCGIAFFVFIAIAIMFLTAHNPILHVYRFTVFIIALGCLTIPFMSNGMTYPYIIIFSGYICFMVIVLIICININSYFDVPATKIGGLAFGTLYIGESMGLGVAYLLTTYLPNEHLLGIFTFLLVGALLFTNIFLLTEKDLDKTPIGKMTDSDDENFDIEVLEEKRTTEALSLIALQCKLSGRESEILPLLFKGRTIARIQEELFISAGTVSTHIHHIYKKTNVKNRQELLDLIDQESHKI